MRRLMALLIFSGFFFIGGGWGGGAAEGPCIGPQELLEYYQAPPNPYPSTVMYGVLEGARAQAFVIATGGKSLASYVGVVYFLYAPVKAPNMVAAQLADEAGCGILMTGERSVSPERVTRKRMPLWFVDQWMAGEPSALSA